MKSNQLGKSGIWVSEIGFGCMSLPLDDEASGAQLLQHAVDSGVTFFDTADLYGQGRNEEVVGKTLQSVRHQVVIATKVGNRWVPGQSGWTWDASKAYILKAVEASLHRLQTDYIDLYQLHGGTMEDSIDEVIETFESLVQKGTIRAYGISSIRPAVIREYVRRSRIASVMTQYSILDRRPEEATLPLLAEAGVSVIARGPVANGLLSDGGKSPDGPYLTYSSTQVEDIRTRLGTIHPDGRRAQVAIRYALSHPAVATVIPGASRLQQLQENMDASRLRPLREDERQTISAWYPANVYDAHR